MHTARLARRLVPIGIMAMLPIAAPVATAQGIGFPAATGAAAPTLDAPRVILSLGAAAMNPVHADDDPEGPVVLGSLGFAVTPRTTLEVEATRRASARAIRADNVLLPYSGASGVPGRADRDVSGRETSDWTVGLNLVGRTPPRTVTLFAGAGAVWHREHLRNYRTLTNCTPPTGAAGPQIDACRDLDDRSRTTDYGFHGLGGADVNISRRWRAFAAVRYELRPDLAMGSFGVTGGVRVGLR